MKWVKWVCSGVFEFSCASPFLLTSAKDSYQVEGQTFVHIILG